MHVIIHVSSWQLAPRGGLIPASVWLTWVITQHISAAALWIWNILLQWAVRSENAVRLVFLQVFDITSQNGTILHVGCVFVFLTREKLNCRIWIWFYDLRDETLLLKAPSSLCVKIGAWWLNWSWGKPRAAATPKQANGACQHDARPVSIKASLTNEIERIKARFLISSGPGKSFCYLKVTLDLFISDLFCLSDLSQLLTRD